MNTPELLCELVLEIINNIPSQALAIYTDERESESGKTGNGVLVKISGDDFRYHFKNPDHSSVFVQNSLL
ncbi:hypothetical protein CEXT_334091 [Caerostris extrusa]|uniref:Uncharacterized protein n=1 Tax=Caerostris extrusa TaxID=172846 RepID=A0AAV4XWR4_CAEEX|nr:hypothetical protein CEXT_334091 [Caerostris extrusa]